MPLTLAEVDSLAERLHRDQTDKIGVPYIEHVRTVSAALAPFGTGMMMAGLLHDVLEDTPTDPTDLMDEGVPLTVVATVQWLTRVKGVPYDRYIAQVALDHGATLVKIADNAHNSRADRLAHLEEKDRLRLSERYREAREALWKAVAVEDVRTIVTAVNPDLLVELDKLTD